MADLRQADLRVALDVVESIGAVEGPDPFPLPALAELQRVLDADVAAGYVETTIDDACGGYALATRPQPTWMFAALEEVGAQDPTHAIHGHPTTEPVTISDFLTVRQLRRLALFSLVCGPLGVADSMRLYLPAPPGVARFFFFDRSSGAFPARARALLRVLGPHLAQGRARKGALGSPAPAALTPRETEILRWVAAGSTNAEVARQLWVTEHTVRKHLENVYAKLGVHTRTAAVAAVSGYPGTRTSRSARTSRSRVTPPPG